MARKRRYGEGNAHEVAEHEGRVPQVGVPTGPRQTVPAYAGSPAASKPVYNPTTGSYYHPTPPPRPTPSTSPYEPHRSLISDLADLVTPGPSRQERETAQKAHRLGVQPKEETPGAKVSDLIQAASQGAQAISQDVAAIPQQRVHSFLGRKTLGTPTIAQLLKASSKTPLFTQEGPTKFYKEAYAHNRSLARPGPWVTPLSPGEEAQFRHWVKAHNVPFNPNAKQTDYDMRGYWKATGGRGWRQGEHFPDTFKTPLDTTFSAQSRYANKRNHQVWRGNVLVDAKTGKPIFDETGGHGLRVNQGGKLTVPATRRAAHQLVAARRQVARTAGGPLPGLGKEEAHIARQVLKVGRAVGASRKEMLAAIDTGLQETGFKNLKPYENGFNENTAGWREELAPYYTGRLNVKKSAREFFKETKTDPAVPGGGGETPGELAQTVQGSAFGGEETYGTHGAQAQKILAAFNHGSGASPAAQKAREALAQAKAKAVGLGIPVQSGDTERGGGGQVVFVRADAKGMVNWAKALLGTQEGSRLQLKWAAESGVSAAEPWCSEFIAAGMQRRGLPAPLNPAYSGTWLDWKGGSNIGTNLQQAKPGDIIVFGPSSHTAHVGLYIGNGQMISGNYGNEVAQAPISQETASEPIAGIVRPHYRGGKVAVKESAVLPGAAIGPGGAIVSGPAGVGAGEVAGSGGVSGGTAYSASLSPLNPLLTPATSELNLSEEPEDIVQAILRRRR